MLPPRRLLRRVSYACRSARSFRSVEFLSCALAPSTPMYRLYISENTKPLMPPTAASRTVNGDPMAPVNPPGNHPIAAPITVVINGPMAPMTILSGDGSAIRFPPVASATHAPRACAFAMGSPCRQQKKAALDRRHRPIFWVPLFRLDRHPPKAPRFKKDGKALAEAPSRITPGLDCCNVLRRLVKSALLAALAAAS